MPLCNEVRSFSRQVYHYLSRVFQYRLGISETGITDVFIFNLVEQIDKQKLKNIRVYKTTWPIESLYGNDIDLFIQRADGRFNRYALQAKVMSDNGSYKDLVSKDVGNEQWDKMLTHEMKFNSQSFYLLYNGKSRIKPIVGSATIGDCIGVPRLEELGLGIVETRYVKQIRESKGGKLYMKHFFPDYMNSIRKLFCCNNGGFFEKDLRGYRPEEIYLGTPYQLIELSKTPDKVEEFESEKDFLLQESDGILPEDNEEIASIRVIISKENFENITQ